MSGILNERIQTQEYSLIITTRPAQRCSRKIIIIIIIIIIKTVDNEIIDILTAKANFSKFFFSSRIK